MNEPARLLKLAEYQVLDTAPEPSFDALTALTAYVTGAKVALVSLVDATRVWFKSHHGSEVSEATRDTSFCTHVVSREVHLVVPDARLDPRFADHPQVVGPPHLRFYAGYPLRTADGFVLGSLCAIDLQPRELSAQQLELMRRLAHLVVDELEMRRQGLQLRTRQHALQNDLRHTSDEAARLHSILSSASLAIVETSPEGVIREFNPAAERLFGYSAEEVVGKTTPILIHDPAEVARRAKELSVELGVEIAPGFGVFKARLDRGIRDEREWLYVRKDGTRFPAQLSLSVRHDVAGEVAGYLGIISDLTARREIEHRLRHHDAVLQLGSDVARAFATSDSLDLALRACTQAIVTNLDAAFARIWTLDESENVLVLRASSGQYTRLDGTHARAPVGKFKIGLIAKDRLPHLTNSVLDDPEVSDREWARREGMVSFAGYPMLLGERVIGVLAMFARHPLSPTVLEALAVVATNAAVWIDHHDRK